MIFYSFVRIPLNGSLLAQAMVPPLPSQSIPSETPLPAATNAESGVGYSAFVAAGNGPVSPMAEAELCSQISSIYKASTE